MALTYGFYNSIEGDRVYDAIQFGRIFDGIIKDGVYATYEKGMMVIASENPSEVIIQPGRAWFNHTWSYNDANVIFEAPAPEVLLERYDALVLEINEELSSRENSYKWVTGTPSSRPERPTLTNTSTIHQYPLCYVHRYPETTMIYTRDITNMIGTSECPFATGVLEGIDLDAWINQWDDEFHNWESTTKTGFETWMLNQEQVYTAWFNSMHSQMDTDLAEFEAWFQTIQGIIDEEAALHLQQEIDELRQEATSGSRIFVHTINQSLFGKNVTITEAGGTVFTSRFDNTGVAEFKSIPYVGNLTISSTDGIQTATSVVNTPYYARYNFTIAFWAATVNIIGDPEMSGSTVTVRDSNEILVGTVVLDSAGTGVFTATAPDTYKFILTYGGETMEVTLSVTQETTYTVDLHAAGFKWEDWLEAGGVIGSYSSLDDVLADEVALRRLFTVHASVDYMADIDKENENVEKIIGTDLAAKWINLRDYALDTLYANTIIKGYMDTADKYFYGEWVNNNGTWAPKGNVPVMTNNNAPYGEVFASGSYQSAYAPYKAFDGDDNSGWISNNVSPGVYIGYKFNTPTKIKRYKWAASSYDSLGTITYKFQASNDGTNWVDLDEYTENANYTPIDRTITGGDYYLYYRFLETALTTASATRMLYVQSITLYGRELSASVPTMTSNTTPYGIVSASSVYSGSGYEAYRAFDGNSATLYNSVGTTSNQYLDYQFNKVTHINQISYDNVRDGYQGNTNITFKFQVSNDGTTWNDVSDILGGQTSNSGKVDVSVDALYVRCLQVSGNNGMAITELQFYGFDYSEKEFEAGTTKKWLYDHGVELETVQEYLGGGTITKNADQIEIIGTTSGGDSTGAFCSVDFTQYTHAFARSGNIYKNATYEAFIIGSTISGTAQAYARPIPLPLAHLDVSSINATYNLYYSTAYSGKCSLKELWLE